MAREKRGGEKIESLIAPSLKKKFKAHCKRNNITQAEILRNFVQALVKKK